MQQGDKRADKLYPSRTAAGQRMQINAEQFCLLCGKAGDEHIDSAELLEIVGTNQSHEAGELPGPCLYLID